MVIVSPFLNRLLHNLGRVEYKLMLTVFMIAFSVIPTINIFGDSFGVKNGYSLLWFCVLYLIGGYIRRFGVEKRKYGIMYFVICVGMLVIKIIAAFATIRFHITIVEVVANLLTGEYNSILVAAGAVCLVLYGIGEDGVRYSSNVGCFIERVSKLSFGVYLFHENNMFRDILWKEIVCLDQYSDNVWRFASRLVFAVIAIFVIGIIVEWGRSKVMKGIFRKRYTSDC